MSERQCPNSPYHDALLEEAYDELEARYGISRYTAEPEQVRDMMIELKEKYGE